jgi:SulP family sulfate permease
LPFREYGLIICILLLIALHGLMVGVAFGLIVASIFFVYSYSQTNCIKHAFTSNTHFSNKERSLEQVAFLKQKGAAARAFCLQGYLFFGTSSSIVETCREAVEAGGVRYLLLDFRMVQGLDASAVLSFTKLEQICAGRDVRLLLSGLRPETEAVLQQSRFVPKKGISIFSDLDRGLEWAEDELLSGLDQRPTREGEKPVLATAAAAEMDLRRILAEHFAAERLDVLIEHCHTLKLGSGEYLFRKGDPGDALYFVERGELSVLLPLSDGQTKRLRTFGPGTVVGEMALYSRQPRSADVVTDGNCRVRKLSAEDFAHLERDHPEVAIQFHSFVVKLLATRLAAANEQIRELL